MEGLFERGTDNLEGSCAVKTCAE